MPTPGSGESQTRHGGHRRQLRLDAGAIGSGRAPELLAGVDFDGIHSGRGFVALVDVGNRGVGGTGVQGRAPLNAALRAPHTDARLPQDLAALIGIQSIDDARLLRRHQDLFPAGERMQYGGAAEVNVLAWIVGAVRALRAADHPVVAGSHLARPQHAAGFEIEGDNRSRWWECRHRCRNCRCRRRRACASRRWWASTRCPRPRDRRAWCRLSWSCRLSADRESSRSSKLCGRFRRPAAFKLPRKVQH